MRQKLHPIAFLSIALTLTFGARIAEAQWRGLSDRSAELGTDGFPFFGFHPEASGNENYYDGDMGDFDGDGLPDRLLGARYGLLFNTGGGEMVPIRRNVGYLLRNDPGATGWGEDAMALVDVDNDGDLDALSGGNGPENLSLQLNERWRFRTLWSERRHPALNIVPTDLERDGDADLVIAHAFCATSSCGAPRNLEIRVNDGTGNYTDETQARGLALGASEQVVGVVSGDVDGDGDFDLVIQRGTDPNGEAIVVAMNDGRGFFTKRVIPMKIGGSGFTQNSALGDIDDDGDLDLVMGHANTYRGGHSVVAHTVALNDGRGNFSDRSRTLLSAGGANVSLVAGANMALVDIDYDGDLDVLSLDIARAAPGDHKLNLLLNDGTGRLVYSARHSQTFRGRTGALGGDVDTADMDGDGDLDVWVGLGGNLVHIFMNEATASGGVPVDVPRSFRVVSESNAGVTLGWQAPSFASSARFYRLYRSLSPGVHGKDRVLIATIGQSAHLDRDFFGTIDRHTDPSVLGDPNVTLSANEVRYTDTTAQPGVLYWYTVTHVGPEHSESAHAGELMASIASSGGSDNMGPELDIVSPVSGDWMRAPRIVLAYGDDGSVDPSSLRVTFDGALGPIAAGQNIVAALPSGIYRHDDHAFVAWLAPPYELPRDTVVNMTATVRDDAGNTTTERVRFFVTISSALASSPRAPAAAFDASTRSGTAPLEIDFDASASSDPDGHVMRWEWYFGDGSTGLGRQVSHTFTYGGRYDVTLVVRDSEGRVATTIQTVALSGPPAPADAGVPRRDAGVSESDAAIGGVDGGASCTPDCRGRTCGDDGCGGSCGSCGLDTICAAGSCACAGATEACDDACVDTRTDGANCGGCGHACESGELCAASTCVRASERPACTPDCRDRTCGDDGCGGSCGTCAEGDVCAAGGQCLLGDDRPSEPSGEDMNMAANDASATADPRVTTMTGGCRAARGRNGTPSAFWLVGLLLAYRRRTPRRPRQATTGSSPF